MNNKNKNFEQCQENFRGESFGESVMAHIFLANNSATTEGQSADLLTTFASLVIIHQNFPANSTTVSTCFHCIVKNF